MSDKTVVKRSGIEVNEAITADEEAGYVLKAVEPLRVEGDLFVTEEMHGTVVITKL